MPRKNMLEITAYHPDQIWFKHGKATTDPTPPFSNYRWVRTIRKARSIAWGILNKWPDAQVEICRLSYKNGQRRMESEIWTRGTR